MNNFTKEFRVMVHTENYEKMTAFYRDTLELESYYSWNYAEDDRGVKYQCGAGTVEVIQQKPPRALGPNWIIVESADVDTCYAGLKAKGCAFTEEIETHPYGVRAFQLADPDGNIVGIFSYVKNQEG